jgi:hypothetical protein
MGGVHRVNGDLAVSRCFGDADYKKTGGPGLEDRPVTANPEMGHFECDPTDFVLVVCDGVSEGSFPNAEVCQLAAKVLRETNNDAAKAAEAICFQSVAAESKDNISAMIILLGGGSAASSGMPVSGKTSEFHPGCLTPCPTSNEYLTAYKAMCVRGGVSFADASAQRYEIVLGRKGTDQEDTDDAEELALIGTPAGAAGSAERSAWFAEWARNCEEGGGDDDDEEMMGGGGGPAGGGGGLGGSLAQMMQGGSAQEQQQMMQMLRGMMQQQQQGGGPGGPGGRK